jgi:DNA-binding transcriptional MerR regulator
MRSVEIDGLKILVLENKAWATISAFLVLMALGVSGLFMNSANLGSLDNQAASGSLGYESADIGIPPHEGGSGSYVQVQEGSIQISSEDVEEDISRIESLAGNYDGWIESRSKTHGDLYTNADLTVKVKSENFQNFTSDIEEEFEVESYNVNNYRLYTERERDELDILNDTMSEVESIREEVQSMENNAEKLDLLMQITEKELEVQEKRNEYENRLSDKQQRGDYATVNLKLKEKRRIDLMPDDLGQSLKNEVNEMVDNVANTLITTLTGGVEIFFTAVKYLIYLAIVAIPATIAWILGRRIYGRIK